jgi:hypothetical protein
MATNISAPSGKSGLAVEPWTPGEVYAVAADWAQASSPIMVYGEDGWTWDEHGRQVADFRHDCRAALECILMEAAAMGGDEMAEDEAALIADAAVEID